MNLRTAALGTLVLVNLAAHGSAGAADREAAAAFARLKTLVGEWEADTEQGKARLVYELTANGTALVERETADNRATMFTVYTLDGNRLLLTHYCMVGNQPRMRAQAFDERAGELAFEFLDATNMANPTAGHMHSVKMSFVDANHLVTEWQFYEDNQPKLVERAKYTRVR